MASKNPMEQSVDELGSGIRNQMSEEDLKSLDMTPEDLAREIQHPRAKEMVTTLLSREKTAPGPGDPAPDFCLRRLVSGAASEDAERVTLSDHFGRRPVALVFGSYT